jgi:phage shock protein C
MNLADDLQKLQTLREQGALSEEEFVQAKKRLLEDDAKLGNGEGRKVNERTPSVLHQLHRSRDDRWVAGVSGGLAKLTNIPTWAWRILFVLTGLLHGVGVVMYILLWIFVPLEVKALPALEHKREP